MEPWLAMVDVAQQVTGRRVVGTAGGLYKFTETELHVPRGSIEGLVHDLCHFVVADDSERRQENMGLSQDWEHPGYDRMVKCEELAWSLETYLFCDPPVPVMSSLLTPEARASGGGVNVSSYNLHLEQIAATHRRKVYGIWHVCHPGWHAQPNMDKWEAERQLAMLRGAGADGQYVVMDKWEAPPVPEMLKVEAAADAVAHRVTEAAIAELSRARETVIGHGELRPEGSEALRREACRKAEEMGLPVAKIQRIVRAWWLETYPPDPPEEDSLPAHWKDLKTRD